MSDSPRAMTVFPRATSTLFSFWAVVGFAALLVGDALVRGSWHVLALSVAPAALAVWAAWMLLFRPSIRFDTDRVVTVNPGRVIEVPWQRVVIVRQRPQLVLELDDGSRVTCWGSPFPEKPGRRPRDASKRRDSAAGDVVGTLEAARSGARSTTPDAMVSRRWDVVPLLGGAVLAVACLIELVLAR
jgi:hypothetical protein